MKVFKKVKRIRQSSLTADCWMIQVWGIESCLKCEYQGTAECGGKRILKEIKAGRFPAEGLPDAE